MTTLFLKDILDVKPIGTLQIKINRSLDVYSLMSECLCRSPGRQVHINVLKCADVIDQQVKCTINGGHKSIATSHRIVIITM